MSYGRFRRDPCGNLKAPERACPKCFRHYMTPDKERAITNHHCKLCIERQRALLDTEKERAS